MGVHRRGSDDLERYLKWRLERYELDRRQLLRGAAGLALSGFSAAALSACGGGDDDEAAGPAPASATTPAESAAQGETLDVLLANHTPFYALIGREFEEQRGATLNFTREQFGLIPAKLTPAFEAGGHSWDVVYIWRAWVEQYRDFLTPLDEVGFTVPPDLEGDMLPVAIEASRALDGKWYGLPGNTYTYVLYGNKKRLAEAGADELPKTYSAFVELAEGLTSGGKVGYTDGWAPLYLQPKWNVWLHLNGGKLYSEGETGEVLFDTPEAMQATRDMLELLPSMPKEAPTSPWGIYDVEAKKVFFSGNAAMIIDYQHIWYEAQNPDISQVGDGNLLVGLVPGKEGGPQSAGQFVGECFAIPKTSEKKEAALELVKFFSDPAQQLGLLTQREELAAFDPAGEDGFPSYKSPYEDPSVAERDRPIIEATFEQQQYPGARYGTRPGYQAIADTIEAAVSAVLNGQKDVEAAHREAQKTLDEIVGQEEI